MIILKHLTVERFRLLHELNLHFPQRGSILIQGPNESGKSALLESIYFSLYGEALQSRGRRSLDDLISYGAKSATIALSLSADATSMTITRTLERGHGQTASLSIQRPGALEEEIFTDLQDVNVALIRELGWMDGETLRNTCLIEQKGLGRLEHISRAQREDAARKLLGLEDLLCLSEQFKITPEDGQRLEAVTQRLYLAQIQARIPLLNKQLEDIGVSLDAVAVREKLDEIALQDAEIAEQEQALENVKVKLIDIKNKQSRIQQLKQADGTLAELIAAYDEIAEARRERPELERQVGDLERRERNELPTLEKRVNELADLSQSFGTLQRMSDDLLSAVDAVKALEDELKQYDASKDDLASLVSQVEHARALVDEAQQALDGLEEHRRSGRPQLGARLASLQSLSASLDALRQAEEQYMRRVASRGKIEENRAHLNRLQRELRDSDEEIEELQTEIQKSQKQADATEQHWRQLNLRKALTDWQQLKSLSQNLNQAEQQLALARQHQTQLAQANTNTHGKAQMLQFYALGLIVLTIICLICAAIVFFSFSQPNNTITAVLILFTAMACGAGAALATYNHKRAREENKAVDHRMQEALNRVGMMAAAREAAVRRGGSSEELNRLEQEIRSHGAGVPRSPEEAQHLLAQMPNSVDNPAELQQQLKQIHDEISTAQKSIKVAIEAVADLRKDRSELEELRQQEDWDNIEENVRLDQASVERMQQEVALLAGQEGLPQASINVRLQAVTFDTFSSGQMAPFEEEEGVPVLETLVDNVVRSIEHEMLSLDGKLNLAADLASQVRIHQEALDILLLRKHVIDERNTRYQATDPLLQIERAREQQTELRQALQSLRDSLRQRVRSLGVDFGQAAITNAEIQGRKQLEYLHITLGNKMVLQEKINDYSAQLKERQESLSDLYKQLSKFSNTLGNWIVPLNPFADALQSLRTRCERELHEIDEANLLKDQESLQNQEGALKVKIALCGQEIEASRENIMTLLTRRKRPAVTSYSLPELVVAWPLLDEYSAQDRLRLSDEQATLEKELEGLQQRGLELSKQLGLEGRKPLELNEAQVQMEQLDRIYQTKKYGLRLVEAVSQQLIEKVMPRTEQYMHQILPLLTGGRYHDVHLITGTEEDTTGSCQLQVWESAAGEYVSKSELSGGASDQLSLALRLAFAIAALPRDASSVPGFVILDEPLSSFDRGRAKALVDVITGNMLGRHFEQVLLISHNNAFDPALFPYHVYMENGLVVESNLPAVPEIAPVVLKRNELVLDTPREAIAAAFAEDDFADDYFADDDDDEECMNAATVHMSAIPAHLNVK